MWIGVLAACCAAGLGAVLALTSVPPVVLHAIRVFALAAVVPAVLLDVLPEATAGMGASALALFALAFWLPSLAARGAGSARSDAVLTAAFFALLVHKLLDGFALGALAHHEGHEHWNVIIALAAHTVPMTCALGLAYLARGATAVWARTFAIAAAIALGAAMSSTGAAVLSDAAPAMGAVAAGLLFHLVLHDLAPPRRTAGVRIAELAGLAAGLGMTWLSLTGAHHDHDQGFRWSLWDIGTLIAPWLAVGLVGRTVWYGVRRTWPRFGGARVGAAIELIAPTRCDLGAVTHEVFPSRMAQCAFAWAYPFLAAEALGFAFFSGMWWHVAFFAAAAVLALAAAFATWLWMDRRIPPYGASEGHHHDPTEHDPHSEHHRAHGAQTTFQFFQEATAHNAGRVLLGVVLAVLVLTSDQTGWGADLGRFIGAVVAGLLFAPLWWLALGASLIASPTLAIAALATLLAYRVYGALAPLPRARRARAAVAAAAAWALAMLAVVSMLAPLSTTRVLVSQVALTNWKVVVAPWATWVALAGLGIATVTSIWTLGLGSWLAGLHAHPHQAQGDHCQEP